MDELNLSSVKPQLERIFHLQSDGNIHEAISLTNLILSECDSQLFPILNNVKILLLIQANRYEELADHLNLSNEWNADHYLALLVVYRADKQGLYSITRINRYESNLAHVIENLIQFGKYDFLSCGLILSIAVQLKWIQLAAVAYKSMITSFYNGIELKIFQMGFDEEVLTGYVSLVRNYGNEYELQDFLSDIEKIGEYYRQLAERWRYLLNLDKLESTRLINDKVILFKKRVSFNGIIPNKA